MQTSEQINELAAALSQAQGEFTCVPRSGVNEHIHRAYATLADVWDSVRAPLAKNGLSVVQTPEFSDNAGVLALTTRLLHASGQWMEGTFCLPVKAADKQQDLHAYMSALTYARRGGLSAILGIAPDADDDGNAAAGKRAAARSGGGLPGMINDSGSACPVCHAPAGKTHATNCKG